MLKPELEERWKMTYGSSVMFNWGRTPVIQITATCDVEGSQPIRHAVRTNEFHPYPMSPFTFAVMMKSLANWWEERFNPDGTLTEKGRKYYLQQLENNQCSSSESSGSQPASS